MTKPPTRNAAVGASGERIAALALEAAGGRIIARNWHCRGGELDLVAQSCEITGFDREIRTATPDLGEHNEEILTSLGYSAEEIEKLKAARAI